MYVDQSYSRYGNISTANQYAFRLAHRDCRTDTKIVYGALLNLVNSKSREKTSANIWLLSQTTTSATDKTGSMLFSNRLYSLHHPFAIRRLFKSEHNKISNSVEI